MRASRSRPIFGLEHCIACIVDTILKRDGMSQVLAVQQVGSVDCIHHVAVRWKALYPEFHVIARNELLFTKRKHYILQPNRTLKRRACFSAFRFEVVETVWPTILRSFHFGK